MSVVISVRVKKEIKELLESEGINIAEEVRRFLEELAYKIRIKRYVEKWDRMLEGVTPSPHPRRPSLVLGLPERFVGFPARTRTPHPSYRIPHSWGITVSGPGGLGSSGFLGAPSPHWLLSTLLVDVQTLNLFR